MKDEQAGTRRMCADASFVPAGTPPGFGSLNQGIPKQEFMELLRKGYRQVFIPNNRLKFLIDIDI